MSLLRCPVCHHAMALNERTWSCDSGHSYDCAKEGYVNLLLSHRKKSKQPGDSKDMLLSRRRFLEAGHFDSVVFGLASQVSQYLSDTDAGSILDLGCGEGYFLRSLVAQLKSTCHCWGIDVAKPAIQMAAKKDKTCHYAVASNNELPFLTDSFKVIFSINAPVYEEEVKRILRDDGVYIRIFPAGSHLFELKKLVYQEPRKHDDEIMLFNGLKHEQREKIEFNIQLGEGEAFDLLSMTPYYWHASEEAQAQVKQLSGLVSPASFNVDIYRQQE